MNPLAPHQRAFFRGTRLWLRLTYRALWPLGFAAAGLVGYLIASREADDVLGARALLLMTGVAVLALPVTLVSMLPLRAGVRWLDRRLDEKERAALRAAWAPRATTSAAKEGAPVAVAADAERRRPL